MAPAINVSARSSPVHGILLSQLLFRERDLPTAFGIGSEQTIQLDYWYLYFVLFSVLAHFWTNAVDRHSR